MEGRRGIGRSGGGKLEMRKIVTTRCYVTFSFFFFLSLENDVVKMSEENFCWKDKRWISREMTEKHFWFSSITFSNALDEISSPPLSWRMKFRSHRRIIRPFDGGEQHLRIIENPLGENHVSSPRICLLDSIGSLDSIRECSLMNWFDFARW